ncbi:head GIN domain-containing protein [Roseivirga pacifica]|jgi:hypothetical protein|uniref:head GIN domain-containing protein n=1 Tax=Roseivirga pacifica TaxID=1267423 RepID=UPI003BAB2A73
MKSKVFGKLSLMVVLMVLSQLVYAQSREKRDVSGFDALSVSDAFVVEISVGNTESLEIEADDEYMDDIITEVRGGTLRIEMKDSRRNRRMKDSPRAYLTVKSLDRISASGAVHIKTFDILKANRFTVDLSGASVINLELDVEDFSFEASGACVVSIEGSAKEQRVKISGSTVYRAYDFETEVAVIGVSGASSASVYASDKLDVRASGASSIRYRGDAQVNSNTSGASSVRKGQ